MKADSYSFYVAFSSVGICAKLVEITILINERLYSNLNASDSRDKNTTTILLTTLSAWKEYMTYLLNFRNIYPLAARIQT